MDCKNISVINHERSGETTVLGIEELDIKNKAWCSSFHEKVIQYSVYTIHILSIDELFALNSLNVT